MLVCQKSEVPRGRGWYCEEAEHVILILDLFQALITAEVINRMKIADNSISIMRQNVCL